jgi:hypothetical protein
LNEGRTAHTATLLDDGAVLLIGGSAGGDQVLRSAERFDPTTGQFTRVDDLHAERHKHAAVRLSDGDVLVIGGSDGRDWRGQYAGTERYDAQTQTFSRGPNLHNTRFKLSSAVVALAEDTVLVGGGNRQLELFDGATGSFTQQKQLDEHYYYATLTRLRDGRVLIAGGYTPQIEATDQRGCMSRDWRLGTRDWRLEIGDWRLEIRFNL